MNVRQQIQAAERIVVKLGTHVVTEDGVRIALGRIIGIVDELAKCVTAGKQVMLVSSGAVGMGMRVMGLTERPTHLGLVQACAAVGQGRLIALYSQAFGELEVTVAQVLLSQVDLASRDRALCLRTTLMRLLELGIVPILNENDSVSVHELIEQRETEAEDGGQFFGDNDGLSARVATSMNADALFLLTDVNGLYTANPQEDVSAERIGELHLVDDAVLNRASGMSLVGRGGMRSKLEAARLASDGDVSVAILDGTMPGVIGKIMEGEDIGTVIAPASRRGAKQRRIAISDEKKGALVVNEGALEAVSQRKASLLPIGVLQIEGDFQEGEVVEIRDTSGRVHGRGLVNYSSDECRKLAGKHSSDIDRIIGWRGYAALITRTNLVLGQL